MARTGYHRDVIVECDGIKFCAMSNIVRTGKSLQKLTRHFVRRGKHWIKIRSLTPRPYSE